MCITSASLKGLIVVITVINLVAIISIQQNQDRKIIHRVKHRNHEKSPNYGRVDGGFVSCTFRRHLSVVWADRSIWCRSIMESDALSTTLYWSSPKCPLVHYKQFLTNFCKCTYTYKRISWRSQIPQHKLRIALSSTLVVIPPVLHAFPAREARWRRFPGMHKIGILAFWQGFLSQSSTAALHRVVIGWCDTFPLPSLPASLDSLQGIGSEPTPTRSYC